MYLADMVGRGGLSTTVAVKLLRQDLDPEGQAVKRLRDEGRLLARLDHPTILRVLDLVMLEGRAALVTEYVPGEDLEGCLRGEGRMGTRALLQVLGRVAGALDAAWRAPLGTGGDQLRLSHRDVKPSNVRVGRFGDVKLLDFGIARSDEVTREARTMTDMMVGSPPYMAPERFLDTVVRSESDVFALGAILLEGLTGQRVFDLPVTMLAAHAVDRARYDRFVEERFERVPADTDPDVTALARTMLDHDPARRPSAKSVEDRCEELADRLTDTTLQAWCRDRAWPVPSPTAGQLEGRVLTAGSMERPVHTLDEPAAPADGEPTPMPPRSRLALWLGGLSVVGAAGLVGVIALSAVGVAAGVVYVWPAGPPVPVSAPVPAPSPVPSPEPPAAPPPAPAPAPAPPPVAPSAPEPSPAPPKPTAQPAPAPPRPVPQPVPEAPRPTPAPPTVAAPAAPPTSSVTFEGAEAVRLQGGAGSFALPSRVPPGDYQIVATFPGRTPAPQGSVVVAAGSSVHIVCNGRMFTCSGR